jgi:hypothetical protein
MVLGRWMVGIWPIGYPNIDAHFPYDPCATTYDQTRARLLACHAAVLRFRWEYERLPKTLEELRLGPLATDPYSGEPFRYDPRPDAKGHPYRLASLGPIVDETGERRAISFEDAE